MLLTPIDYYFKSLSLQNWEVKIDFYWSLFVLFLKQSDCMYNENFAQQVCLLQEIDALVLHSHVVHIFLWATCSCRFRSTQSVSIFIVCLWLVSVYLVLKIFLKYLLTGTFLYAVFLIFYNIYKSPSIQAKHVICLFSSLPWLV